MRLGHLLGHWHCVLVRILILISSSVIWSLIAILRWRRPSLIFRPTNIKKKSTDAQHHISVLQALIRQRETMTKPQEKPHQDEAAPPSEQCASRRSDYKKEMSNGNVTAITSPVLHGGRSGSLSDSNSSSDNDSGGNAGGGQQHLTDSDPPPVEMVENLYGFWQAVAFNCMVS